jgi:protein phosphatase
MTSQTQAAPAPVPATEGRHPTVALAVRTCGLTHPGKVRENNEDHFVIAELSKLLRVLHTSLPQSPLLRAADQGYLFIVADGMGGNLAGEQASNLTVLTLEQFILNALHWFFRLRGPEGEKVLADFQAAIRQADSRLLAEAAAHPEWHGMGTTLTMAYAFGPELFVAHVGDSRCYLFRGGELYQITHDHTLIQELVRRGSLSPEEAEQHPYRHVITNCVGGNDKGVHVEVHRLGLEPGDTLLLCSDGLTEMVKDDRLRAVLVEEEDLQRACERLVALANDNGGKDNVTVVLGRFDAAG